MSNTVVTRICYSCKLEKPLDHFVTKKNKPFGKAYQCRLCGSAERKATHIKNKDADKEWARQYHQRPAVKERARLYSHKRRKNPAEKIKIQARLAVSDRVIRGKLIRSESCQQCGLLCKTEAHHHKGYERKYWLDVIWLCPECHRVIDLPPVKPLQKLLGPVPSVSAPQDWPDGERPQERSSSQLTLDLP
jgi:hypothetical protein